MMDLKLMCSAPSQPESHEEAFKAVDDGLYYTQQLFALVIELADNNYVTVDCKVALGKAGAAYAASLAPALAMLGSPANDVAERRDPASPGAAMRGRGALDAAHAAAADAPGGLRRSAE